MFRKMVQMIPVIQTPNFFKSNRDLAFKWTFWIFLAIWRPNELKFDVKIGFKNLIWVSKWRKQIGHYFINTRTFTLLTLLLWAPSSMQQSICVRRCVHVCSGGVHVCSLCSIDLTYFMMGALVPWTLLAMCFNWS